MSDDGQTANRGDDYVDPVIHRHAIVENRPRRTGEELARAQAWLNGERQDEYQAMFYRGDQSHNAAASDGDGA